MVFTYLEQLKRMAELNGREKLIKLQINSNFMLEYLTVIQRFVIIQKVSNVRIWNIGWISLWIYLTTIA